MRSGLAKRTERRAFVLITVVSIAFASPGDANGKASLTTCHQRIAKTVEKLRSQSAKAVAKCLDGFHKEKSRYGHVTAKAADKCEKSLAKVLNIGGRQGKGAINKAAGALFKLFRPGRETCTSSSLAELGLLESQRNAPGFAAQDFPVAALATQALDLALREATAVSAMARSNLDEALALTDCDGANAATGPKQCTGPQEPASCCLRKGRGTCRPNLCAFAAERTPACRTRACTLSFASGIDLVPAAIPLDLDGVSMALTTCRTPENLDALPIDFAGAYRLLSSGSAQQLSPAPRIQATGDTVCLEWTRSQGWCDCDGGLESFEPSSCIDHIVNDDLGVCREGECHGGTPGNSDVGDSCTRDLDCDGGAGTCREIACRTDGDCGKHGLCTDLHDGACSETGAPCSDSTSCSGRREVCVATDDCGAPVPDAQPEVNCRCASSGTSCRDAACVGATCVDDSGVRACHPGTYNGAIARTWSGLSQAGDCAVIATIELTVLPPALCVDASGNIRGACDTPCAGPASCGADTACLARGGSACAAANGDDGVACTRDDRPLHRRQVRVPLTTGTSTFRSVARLSSGGQGSCDASAANAGVNCASDADCIAADPNAATPPSCQGVAAIDSTTATSGAGVSCGNLDSGVLAGLKLVGHFPWLDTDLDGDAAAQVTLECQ